MATTRWLLVDQEQIEDSELIVASGLSNTVQAILPEVSDGSGDTVDNDFLMVVVAQGDGGIELLDNLGRRVWYVRPRTAIVLRSTDEPSGSIRWNLERPAQIEAVKIVDLAATNLATAVAGSGLALSTSDTFSEAGINAAVDAAIDAAVLSAETLADATLTEIEDVCNLMVRALILGLGQGLESTPNAGTTTAAADTPAPAVADTLANTVKLYTSARAFDVLVRLADVSGNDGRGTRFEANGLGGIRVEDNYGRFIGYVPAGQNAYAQSSDNTNRPYQFFAQDSLEIPMGRTATPGFLRITRLSGETVGSAMAAGSAYTSDAAQNTALDLAVDTVLDDLDANTDAAFDEIQAFLNALLLTLEAADITDES